MNLLQSQNIDQILALMEVYEAGSFTGAAKSMGRHSTIISRRVSELEARLGVRLVERTTRSLQFTEAGLAYVERIRGIRSALEEADREASDSATELRGVLRIAVPGTFGRLWLAPLIARFSSDHPTLKVHAQYSERFVDVIQERFDVAIRIGQLQDSSLHAKKISDSLRIVCASPEYLARHGRPNSPDELLDHACLGFTEWAKFPTVTLNSGSEKRVLTPKYKLECNDGEALLKAALDGAGVMIGSEWLVGSSIKHGKLVHLLSQWTVDASSGIYIVRPSINFPPAKVRAFKVFIEDSFSSGVPWR
ncbi:LysR family transcriptional regulator [Pseudomonas putida]|uniref:LysR family transcriptional regulator n=1 Tax=Pseudomonas putida TaxID=303 RepID=A0A8I1EFU9_PSEPU|nr:LysR family transcriptional regulator [Pseudomonas putida]MBI6884990.1 LysR family transcriptional regulator [Pseudomonas putida]